MLQRFGRLLHTQQAAFLVVGAINLAIGLTSFALLYTLAGKVIGYLATLVLAYAIATLGAFTLHRRFVFRVQGQVITDFWRFVVVNAAAFSLNALMLALFVEVAGIPVLPAQLLAIVFVVVFNYFGHSLFSFRRTPHQPGSST